MGSATTMKITDKKELVKLVSFMAMADGSPTEHVGLYKQQGGSGAKLVMSMGVESRGYIDWCNSVLSNITGVKVYEDLVNISGRVVIPHINLVTKFVPFLTKIMDRMYYGKYKSLDHHALKMLDYQALAILYMCNGSLYTHKSECSNKQLLNDSYSVYLNLKRLSYGDQLLLKKFLKDKLDLEWNINRCGKYYNLKLRNKDIPKFMEGVSPFVLPYFQRKIISDFRTVSPL